MIIFDDNIGWRLGDPAAEEELALSAECDLRQSWGDLWKNDKILGFGRKISISMLTRLTWQDSGHYNCSSQRGLKNSLNLVVTGLLDFLIDGHFVVKWFN